MDSGMEKLHVGYLRLSRDDNQENYASIAHQQLIIEQYAKERGIHIAKWYIDDGISGYQFDRPAFLQMLADIAYIDAIYAKDLSRIGRHNAKTLLFLDNMKASGVRVVLVNDDYDSAADEDDILGIKTWYNERYVKDTSKKIKRVIRSKQIDGTAIVKVPWGYYRNPANKQEILMDEEVKPIVQMIYEMYIHDYGTRSLARKLDEMGILTPSAYLQQKAQQEGKEYHLRVAVKWNSSNLDDILKNDFYTGVYRLHKRERKVLHGSDSRVPKEEQITFENHHPAMITAETFAKAQQVSLERKRSDFSRTAKNKDHLFAGKLFCAECGKCMTTLSRQGEKYYNCRSYNTYGADVCSSHWIKETEILQAVTDYIQICRDALAEQLQQIDVNSLKKQEISQEMQNKQKLYKNELRKREQEQALLLESKMRDLAKYPEQAKRLEQVYGQLHKKVIQEINYLEEQLSVLKQEELYSKKRDRKVKNALGIVDEVIQKQAFKKADIQMLIDRIEIDRNRNIEIYFKYKIPDIQVPKHEQQLRKEILLQLRGQKYTSVKRVTEQLNRQQIKVYDKKLIPYFEALIQEGILAKTNMKHTPYQVLADNEELDALIMAMDSL